jgi:hypothetical protein
MVSGDYAMINWLKNKLSKEAAADQVEETPDEVEENFAPVSVRVNPPVAVRVKPADTYIEGYNVDEAEFDADGDHTMAVNDIKTTGVDPYNTGSIDLSDVKKSVPEQ